MEQELQIMDQRLTDMEEKMTSIDTKLTQVVDAILGNPLTKAGGFINDIEVLKSKIIILEKKVDSQEDFKKRVYWSIGIITSIIAGTLILVQHITNIYSTLKH